MKSITATDADGPGWGAALALDDRHQPMIARLEAQAATAGYRWRVVAAGMLGYIVVLGILALFGGLTLLMVLLMFQAPGAIGGEIKGAVIFGGIFWVMARALMLPRAEQAGFAVQADDAPELFALIDRLRRATGSSRVDAVRITPVLNAAVVQEPRWLIFGNRNTLQLGWLLLCAADVDEVAAVIAHELGHFGGRHGRSAGFVYGVRQRWMRLADALPHGIVAGLLRRSFAWYGPWFAAYSFVLSRRQEYEADAAAARVVGADVVARALTRTAIQSARHSEFWAFIWSQADARDDPPVSPSTLMAEWLQSEDADEEAMLAAALAEGATLDDTHPSLAQRLAALGYDGSVPGPFMPAAQALLDPFIDRVMGDFDETWHGWADAEWAQAHREAQDRRAEREDLADRFHAGTATEVEAVRYGALVARIDGPADALPVLREVTERFAESDEAWFRYAVALLDCDDDAGIAILDRLAHRDLALAEPAMDLIIAFLERKGRGDEAHAIRKEAAVLFFAAAQVRQAGRHIDETVVLEPLPSDLRTALAARVREVAGVRRLYAACRHVEGAREPQIVFVFAAGNGFGGGEVLDALVTALTPLGHDLLGLHDGRSTRWLRRRMATMPGCAIVAG